MDTTSATTGIDSDGGQYRLLAWLSPAFPVGGFSYSHGLETAVEAGAVTNRAQLRDYLRAVLDHGSARNDAILFAAAWRAVAADDHRGFVDVAERSAAMRGTAELSAESVNQGEAFLSTLEATWPGLGTATWRKRLAASQIPATYPVAVALATAVAGMPLERSLSAYLQAFIAGLIAAAVKLVPLGQTDGQRTVAALERPVAAAMRRALACSMADVGSAAPLLDQWSARHETQYTRLFRS